jgi:hypothetical protein
MLKYLWTAVFFILAWHGRVKLRKPHVERWCPSRGFNHIFCEYKPVTLVLNQPDQFIDMYRYLQRQTNLLSVHHPDSYRCVSLPAAHHTLVDCWQ